MFHQNPQNQDYKLLLAEPGILIEILLPKKSRFQGALHDSLKAGAYINNVRDHFREKKNRPGLEQLLGFYKVFSNYTDRDITTFESVFRGYSIYEVDGVFYSGQNKQNMPPAEYEERTQIIKLIFLPNYDRRGSLSRERKIALMSCFTSTWTKGRGQKGRLSPLRLPRLVAAD